MQSITLFSVFLLGLSYGSTACMFSCMPFLTPLLVNNSNSMRQSFGVVFPFSMGRVFTYTLISVFAFSSAVFVKALLNDNAVFQISLGVFTILMGSYMLYGLFYKEKNSCASSDVKKTPTSMLGFFGIGALVSISPCVPLLTLITISANGTSYFEAVGFGIAFGLGAVLVPFVFYGFFLSNIFKGLLVEFKSYAKKIQIVASLFLVIVGILVITKQITL
ncbi:sulfite exporter TauE/SafE family protein [Sulfurimonas sp.]|uniref:urease accessory protein UreH domain-containing protein n=1 Tax=Sulfurimonas sp. TaxID=2022749 RepID=UPI003D0B62C4